MAKLRRNAVHCAECDSPTKFQVVRSSNKLLIMEHHKQHTLLSIFSKQFRKNELTGDVTAHCANCVYPVKTLFCAEIEEEKFSKAVCEPCIKSTVTRSVESADGRSHEYPIYVLPVGVGTLALIRRWKEVEAQVEANKKASSVEEAEEFQLF